MQLKVYESLGMDIIRTIFGILDGAVYSLIASAYDAIKTLSELRVNNELYESIASRIYTFLAIFMLFKVAFSFISYIVNPDAITDKEKGVQNIVKNIIIMFIMLVMCPWCFEQLYGLQNAILQESVIENFIFGTDKEAEGGTFQMDAQCGDNKVKVKNTGDYISLILFRPFYQKYSTSWPGDLKSNYCPTSTEPKDIGVSDYLYADIVTAADGANWTSHPYDISYVFLISTAVGIVALLIIVTMLLDIAKRAVTLVFYELISPVPIISYIDPKSGKNGMFKKWLTEVGKTWLSLFIKLFSFNFAIFAIQKIFAGQFFDNTGDLKLILSIVLIIGCLMFAKELPKIIENILGIKISGEFSINPLKKVREQALGGKLVAGAITGAAAGSMALAGGAAANAWATHSNNAKAKAKAEENTYKWAQEKGVSTESSEYKKRYKQEFREAGGRGYAGTMIAGGASSAVRAIARGKDGTWHPIKNASTGVKASSQARNLRDKGYGIDDKVKDYLTDVAGIKFSTGTTSQLKEEVNKLEQNLANLKRNEQAMTNALSERISGMGNLTGDLLRIFDGAAETYDAKGNITSYKLKTYEEYAENAARLEAQNQGDNWDNLTDSQKSNYISMAEHYGTVVDRATFNSLNDLYNARNEADIEGRKTEREINDYKENMDKFKNRKS